MKACKALQRQPTYTLREVAKVIGLLVSSFFAVMYGPLYYRQLERDKSIATKDSKGNYNTPMSLSPETKMESKWWIDNIEEASNIIEHAPPPPPLQSIQMHQKLDGVVFLRAKPVGDTGQPKNLKSISTAMN